MEIASRMPLQVCKASIVKKLTNNVYESAQQINY